jgi:hypothetical protein
MVAQSERRYRSAQKAAVRWYAWTCNRFAKGTTDPGVARATPALRR